VAPEGWTEIPEAVVATLPEFFAPRTATDGSIRIDVVFRYALGRRARAS